VALLFRLAPQVTSLHHVRGLIREGSHGCEARQSLPEPVAFFPPSQDSQFPGNVAETGADPHRAHLTHLESKVDNVRNRSTIVRGLGYVENQVPLSRTLDNRMTHSGGGRSTTIPAAGVPTWYLGPRPRADWHQPTPAFGTPRTQSAALADRGCAGRPTQQSHGGRALGVPLRHPTDGLSLTGLQGGHESFIVG